MKLTMLLCSSCALLFSSLSLNAQQEREARMWLTTPDRTALVAPQAARCTFPRTRVNYRCLRWTMRSISSRSMVLALR